MFSSESCNVPASIRDKSIRLLICVRISSVWWSIIRSSCKGSGECIEPTTSVKATIEPLIALNGVRNS